MKNKILNKKFIIILAVSALLFYLVYRLIIAFGYGLELSVAESNSVYNAMKVASGKSLYTDPESSPYEILMYTPLSQLPFIVAAVFFNSDSPSYVYNIISFGRSFAFMCNIIVSLICFIITYKLLVIDKIVSVIVGVVSLLTLNHLSFSMRPDAMAGMIVVVALYFIIRGFMYHRISDYILFSILISISFFVKQDAAIIAPFTVFFIAVRNSIKLAVITTVVGLLTAGSIFLVMYWIWGDPFIVSAINGLDNPRIITRSIQVLDRFVQLYGYFIGIFTAVYLSLIYTRTKQIELSYLLYIGLSLLIVGFITSLKDGSWVNYYLNFIIISIILSGYLLDKAKKLDLELVYAGSIVLIIGAFYFVFSQWFHYTSPFFDYTGNRVKYYSKWEEAVEIKSMINESSIFVGTDKHLKLFLYPNSIMPNTDYYPVSPFEYSLSNQDAPDYVVITNQCGIDCIGQTLKIFSTLVDDYKPFRKINDAILYSKY